MRLEFLGTGTSAGVPALGCECAVCTSPDPRDQRLRTSAAIRWTDAGGHERTVLIDCGPDFRQQALRARLRRLDAILFTHNHVDHTFGLDEVRRFNAVQKAAIDVYAEEHTLGFLRRVYEHIFDQHRNVNDSFVATLIANRVQPGVAVPMHGVSFTPVRLLHGRLPIVGYRVEAEHAGSSATPSVTLAEPRVPPPPHAGEGRDASGVGTGRSPVPPGPFPLAYCTDVSAVPPEAWGQLAGVRTLVLDALRHRHHPTHLTVSQAVSIAERIGAARTYFVHMSHDLAHEATQAELPEGMFLAHDGLVLGEGGEADQ
ncbi:MAG: MBL fold metallo-hydrolase [Phycisphaerales bacterium]